jgi:hypothetical protein
MSINFKHTQTGLLKECPEGFSWTYFFFGPVVGLFRGMWIPAAVSFFTVGFANLYYMFVINKNYAAHLMEKGYSPAGEVDRSKLVSMGLLSPTPPANHHRVA